LLIGVYKFYKDWSTETFGEKGQRGGLFVKPLPFKSKTGDTLITGGNINKKGSPISELALHD
jgi:hypothetical protein